MGRKSRFGSSDGGVARGVARPRDFDASVAQSAFCETKQHTARSCLILSSAPSSFIYSLTKMPRGTKSTVNSQVAGALLATKQPCRLCATRKVAMTWSKILPLGHV